MQEVTGLIGQPRNLVAEFRRRLQTQIGSDCFELWFNAEDSVLLDGAQLIISASDEFSMDRIKASYRHPIDELASQLGIAEVRFEVRDLPAANSLSVLTDAQQTVQGNSESVVVISSSGSEQSEPEAPGSPASRRPEFDSLEDAETSRRNLSTGRENEKSAKQVFKRPRFALRDFIFDNENQILRNACKQVLETPGELSPFYLFGRAGSGKTHLLEGLAAEARKRSRAGRVQLVTAEQFTSDYVVSLKNRTMPMFRKRYRELDYLLVDDLQFFAGKTSTLGELQHTIEVVTRKGGQVIVSADRSPHELEFAGPEFIHRVACGLTTQISSPTEQTRERIVAQLAARKGIRLEPCAIKLIAAEVSGDARLIAGALNRLKLFQLVHGQPVTAADARKYLSDIVQISHRTVTLTDIENAVCELFGLERKTLRSASKVKAVSQPRMLAMWLSRKYTRAALSEIGDYFGGGVTARSFPPNPKSKNGLRSTNALA